VFPNVEVRHLRAVVVLAEELNFTRAAHRLHVTQSTLSRQITEIEEKCGFRLFNRDNRRTVRVELTDAGRVFLDAACSSLLNMERAVQLARTAQDGGGNALLIGYSPCVDEAWVSAILAIRLPRHPKLRVQLSSQFSIELFRSVLTRDLNLALVTAPPQDSEITAAPFAATPLYTVLPVTHSAAHSDRISLQDLTNDEWILFARRVHPIVHDAIIDAAQRRGIGPKHSHDVLTVQQAVHLVCEHVGVAILSGPAALGYGPEGIVIRPLSDPALCFETCLILRSDDDSKLANEFARSFLRQYSHRCPASRQMELSLTA
jgi:DNA-binding transcriptional LysR family regulator